MGIPRIPETLAKILHGDIDVPMAWLGDRCLKPNVPFKQKQGKGPNGRPFCRWCRCELPEGRTAWCRGCRHLALVLMSWGSIKSRVFDRDHGVCAMCGWDLERLHTILWNMRSMRWGSDNIHDYEAASRWAHEFFGLKLRQKFYDVDHIVPMWAGGRIGLSNLRTLCRPCHRRVTKETMARRNQTARDTKVPLFNENGSP